MFRLVVIPAEEAAWQPNRRGFRKPPKADTDTDSDPDRGKRG